MGSALSTIMSKEIIYKINCKYDQIKYFCQALLPSDIYAITRCQGIIGQLFHVINKFNLSAILKEKVRKTFVYVMINKLKENAMLLK